MAKTKYVIGVPRWIQDPPSKERVKQIKDNSYSFIEALALKGKMPNSATKTIQSFLEVLADGDTNYKDFNKKHINTQYALMEKIRLSLRNSIDKVEKQIKEGVIVIGPTNEVEYDQKQSPKHSQAGQEKDESVENAQENSSHHSNVSSQIKSHMKSQSEKHSISQKISSRSKDIAKKSNSIKSMKSDLKLPSNWRQISMLKEIIRGRRFELRDLEEKHDKAVMANFETSEPVTPPLQNMDLVGQAKRN